MKKLFVLSAFFTLLSCFAYAQNISGDWYGLLNIQGTKLRLVFHITKAGDTYTTTMDSPDQGASGLPVDKTTVTGNQLMIAAAKFGIKYNGNYLPDSNKITGVFTQGGTGIPLSLTRNKIGAANPVVRPQDPTSFPYKQEEVMISNLKANVQLAGTLTIPANAKVSKIVILITGSGPQNRNEELFDHRPFLVWSDWLTRNGIAVLRYDDRGVGKSTGNFSGATTFDFADDVDAAVTFIRSRPDLNKLSIGLVGHSEGGIIAPIVAAHNKDVKFIVLLAGPGVPIKQLMLQQTADVSRVAGAPDTVTNQTVARNKDIYDLIIRGTALTDAQLKNQIDTTLYHDMLKQHADMSKFDDAKQQYGRVITPWFRCFMNINPTDYLTKVKCPILALDGTKDLQVNSQSNLAGIAKALDKGGNKHYKTVPLEGLNHLFQKTNTGNVTEYGQLSETVNPIALTTVSNWINTLPF